MKNFKQKIIAKKVEHELKIQNAIVDMDESSCDGCGDCVDVCPHSAIQMKTLSAEEVKQLSCKGRLKVKIKGSDKAYINPEICTSCGLCMKECREFAIHKVKNSDGYSKAA